MPLLRPISQSALAASLVYSCAAATVTCALVLELPQASQTWVFVSIVAICMPLAIVLSQMHQRLNSTEQKLLSQAELDPLTGLLNRPAFFDRCQQQVNQQHDQLTHTLLLIDIDHFSEFSESYGDRSADRVLQHVAAHLVARVRSDDLFARMDGERFALLLRGANLAQSERLAARMIAAISQRPFSESGSVLEFTASCGFADSSNGQSLDELFNNAKAALLRAKRAGHNQAVAFQSDQAPANSGNTEDMQDLATS